MVRKHMAVIGDGSKTLHALVLRFIDEAVARDFLAESG
jgi:hypothetical protein